MAIRISADLNSLHLPFDCWSTDNNDGHRSDFVDSSQNWFISHFRFHVIFSAFFLIPKPEIP